MTVEDSPFKNIPISMIFRRNAKHCISSYAIVVYVCACVCVIYIYIYIYIYTNIYTWSTRSMRSIRYTIYSCEFRKFQKFLSLVISWTHRRSGNWQSFFYRLINFICSYSSIDQSVKLCHVQNLNSDIISVSRVQYFFSKSSALICATVLLPDPDDLYPF